MVRAEDNFEYRFVEAICLTMANADDDLDRAARIFCEATIKGLAGRSKFSADANLEIFADYVRTAAFFYFQDISIGSAKTRHDEIGALSKAADGRKYELLSSLLKTLSPMSRWQLEERAQIRGMALPTDYELRNIDGRDSACDAIAALLRLGGRYEKGRVRPNGKRSWTWRQDLLRPVSPRNFPKRECERAFVERLQLAWCTATKCEPAPTASRQRKGPFVRFVDECLALILAQHASAVDLINEIARQKRTRLSTIKAEPKAD